jgi:hypothetical protein
VGASADSGRMEQRTVRERVVTGECTRGGGKPMRVGVSVRAIALSDFRLNPSTFALPGLSKRCLFSRGSLRSPLATHLRSSGPKTDNAIALGLLWAVAETGGVTRKLWVW